MLYYQNSRTAQLAVPSKNLNPEKNRYIGTPIPKIDIEAGGGGLKHLEIRDPE